MNLFHVLMIPLFFKKQAYLKSKPNVAFLLKVCVTYLQQVTMRAMMRMRSRAPPAGETTTAISL